MYQPLISTERLELHHIPADGLIELFEIKSDIKAIAGRDFTNPHRVLIHDSGPLAWRVPQVKEDSSTNKWFVRSIVLRESREIVGSTSFHGVPDENGMMEIGIGIEEPFRGKGYAREALRGMWLWVCEEPEVNVLRYTVSPSNTPSIAIIEFFGFAFIDVQIDEEDGPENIYEMSVEDFKAKWGSKDER